MENVSIYETANDFVVPESSFCSMKQGLIYIIIIPFSVLYFLGVCNKTTISVTFVGYEVIIVNSLST